MQRTNSRNIQLPLIFEAGEERVAGLSTELVEELNARSYDYGKRTAIHTLDDYVIEPFSTTLKERAFAEATEAVGLDSRGVLKGSYSIEVILNGKKFVASVGPVTRPSYEIVLSMVKDFLNTVIADNKAGVTRKGIVKISEDAYIFVDYLLNVMERFKSENSTTFNRKVLAVKDPTTNETLPLDEKIEKMLVYLNLNRFAHISPENGDGFYSAMSLKGRIEAFLRSFEERIKIRHGVPLSGLSESQPIDYKLGDGSAVRYLFFSETSTKHGETYKGLVGKETKNIAASNGDLDVLKELAFKSQYEYIRGGEGIRVNTETDNRNTKKGIIKILRISKDGAREERTYSVFDKEGKVYVRVKDILFKALRILTEKYTSMPTQLKIDFFAALPAYLK